MGQDAAERPGATSSPSDQPVDSEVSAAGAGVEAASNASPSDEAADSDRTTESVVANESTTSAPVTPSAAGAPAPTTDRDANATTMQRQSFIASLTIFVLAVFVGMEVISKVPPTLHTPLMSGSNAISGITLVGAVIVAAVVFEGRGGVSVFAQILGFIAVTLASINVVGGFLVTHRMLAMFKRK